MDEQLKLRIEQAATSMLSDDEICISLNITKENLEEYSTVLQRARINLKQKLNSKRISDAATTGGDRVTELVNSIPRGTTNLGGARSGAGRPRGSTNKITAAALLASIENRTGESFENLLAQGYYESIITNDRITRNHYEKLFMSKVMADRLDVDLKENVNTIEERARAFREALAELTRLPGKIDD